MAKLGRTQAIGPPVFSSPVGHNDYAQPMNSPAAGPGPGLLERAGNTEAALTEIFGRLNDLEHAVFGGTRRG